MTPPLDASQPVLNDRAVVTALLQRFCTDVPDAVRGRLLRMEMEALQHMFAIRPRLVPCTQRRTTSMRHPAMSMAVRQYFLSHRAVCQRLEERQQMSHLRTASMANAGGSGSFTTPREGGLQGFPEMFPGPITTAYLEGNDWELLGTSHARIAQTSKTVRYAARLIATDDLVNDAIVRFWDRLTVAPQTEEHGSAQSIGEAKAGFSCTISGLLHTQHALVMTSMQYVYLHLRIANVLLPPDTISLDLLDAIAADLRTDATLSNEMSPFGLAPSRVGALFSPDEMLLDSRTLAEDAKAFRAIFSKESTRNTQKAEPHNTFSEHNSSFVWPIVSVSSTEAPDRLTSPTGASDVQSLVDKKETTTKTAKKSGAAGRHSSQMDPTDVGVTLSMLPDVTFAQFWQSMLELADNWTNSSHPVEYVAFLMELYCEVFAHEWDEDDETFKKALRSAMGRRSETGRRPLQKSGTVSMPAENENIASDVMTAFNDMLWPSFELESVTGGSEAGSGSDFQSEHLNATGSSSRPGSNRHQKKGKNRKRLKSGSAASRSGTGTVSQTSRGSDSLTDDEEDYSGSLSFVDGEERTGKSRTGSASHHRRSRHVKGSHSHRRHKEGESSDELSEEEMHSTLTLFSELEEGENGQILGSFRRRSKSRRSCNNSLASFGSSTYSLDSDEGEKRRRRRKGSTSRRYRNGEKGDERRHSRSSPHRRRSRQGHRRRHGRPNDSTRSGSNASSGFMSSSSFDSRRLSWSIPLSLMSVAYSVPDEELTPRSAAKRVEERAELRRRREEYRRSARYARRRERDRRRGSLGGRDGHGDSGREGARYKRGDRNRARDRDRRRESKTRRERERRGGNKGESKRPRLVGEQLMEKRRRVMEMLRMKGIHLQDDFISDEELQRMDEDGAIDPALLERLMRSAAGFVGDTLTEEDFLHILLGDDGGNAAGGGDIDASTAQSVLDALRRRRDMGRLETQAERHKRKVLERKLREELRAQRKAEKEAARAAARALAEAREKERYEMEKEPATNVGKTHELSDEDKLKRRVLQPRVLSTSLESLSSDSLVGLWVPQPANPDAEKNLSAADKDGTQKASSRPWLPVHAQASTRSNHWRLFLERKDTATPTDLHEFSPARLELFYKSISKNKPCHARARLAPMSSLKGGTYHQLPSISMRYGGGIDVRHRPTLAPEEQRCAPVKLFSLTKKRTVTAAIKESLRRYVDDKAFLDKLQKPQDMK